MIDGREKRNRQLAFELQNSHFSEKGSNQLQKGKGHLARILIKITFSI